MKVICAGLFLLLFLHKAAAGGIPNEYGVFIPVRDGSTYAVKFVLDPENKEFAKFQEVEMRDYGNDGGGDAVVILYRNGDKEVFFRESYEFRRYIAMETVPREVCGGRWSPKIEYHVQQLAWKCSKMNFLTKAVVWWEIDRGLAEAKKEDWRALTERILKGARKVAK